MTDVLKAAFLGLVQGITEFFPISSSAHLKALREVTNFEVEGLAFDVAVHVATLLAVLVYFRGEIVRVVRQGRSRPVFARVVVGSIPILPAGLLLASIREGLSLWSLVVCWLVSATYLLLTRGRRGTRRYFEFPFVRVVFIGIAQTAALFPGISRSGASISAGLWLGLNREEAAKFSFLLAIPAIAAAGLFEGLKLARAGGSATSSTQDLGDLWLALSVAMPVAFGAGMLAIHSLLKLVQSDYFHRFGWYNLTAALAFALYLALRG